MNVSKVQITDGKTSINQQQQQQQQNQLSERNVSTDK